MIKPEMVPKEAMEAAAVQFSNGRTTAQAIAAALNAWPGVRKPMRVNGLQSECWLELPLPTQENGDEA